MAGDVTLAGYSVIRAPHTHRKVWGFGMLIHDCLQFQKHSQIID